MTAGGTIGTIQDGAAAVLALVAAGIAASLPAGASAEVGFSTFVAAMALGSLATGVVFLGLGTFRLGELIRFIPYPVVGGFLAGTGLVLSMGEGHSAALAAFQFNVFRAFILGGHTTGGYGTCQKSSDRYQYQK